MRHNGMDSMTLFTGSKRVSHATKAEGTKHTARLNPTVSRYYQGSLFIITQHKVVKQNESLQFRQATHI